MTRPRMRGQFGPNCRSFNVHSTDKPPLGEGLSVPPNHYAITVLETLLHSPRTLGVLTQRGVRRHFVSHCSFFLLLRKSRP